jgi:hypothetical protein
VALETTCAYCSVGEVKAKQIGRVNDSGLISKSWWMLGRTACGAVYHLPSSFGLMATDGPALFWSHDKKQKGKRLLPY